MVLDHRGQTTQNGESDINERFHMSDHAAPARLAAQRCNAPCVEPRGAVRLASLGFDVANK